MQGRRLHDLVGTVIPSSYAVGDFWRARLTMGDDWHWYCALPNGHIAALADVVVHGDKTITATVHMRLDHGYWMEAS